MSTRWGKVQGTVCFVAYKETTQTIVPGGTDGAKVTVHTDGTVDGETADNEAAVIAVKTGELPFDGGTSEFSLTVNEAGKESRTINVTLTITTHKTGAAVFKVTRKEATLIDENNRRIEAAVETLERLDTGAESCSTFQGALEWADVHALADTEYLLRVEQDNTSLPRFALTFDNRENVILRLKGSKMDGDGEVWSRVLKHGNTASISFNVNSAAWPETWSDLSISNNLQGEVYGFFLIGHTISVTPSKKTFILGSNITIQGLGNAQYSSTSYVRSAVRVCENTTFVMEKGSTITDWYTTSSSHHVIYVETAGNAGKDPTKHGKMRIEGGSITNCTFHNSRHLIRFQGAGANFSNFEAGTFYKAASTPENPIVFSGNKTVSGASNNLVGFNYNTDYFYTYDLAELTGELSIPAN